jgi:parvulin-like peptidyl-prolyl isomerase
MSALAPSRKEITLYYKTHRSEFVVPEQIHVFHIVKNVDETENPDLALVTIKTALSELESGERFSTVADRHSDCAGNGGELGWVERGTMVEEFEKVAFNLPIGRCSSVFETRFGFHIALVVAKRGPGVLPLAAVYDQISNLLSSPSFWPGAKP